MATEALLWRTPTAWAATVFSSEWPQQSGGDGGSLSEEEDARCAYASKKCTNPRTTKKGGGLHRFCEFHRRRANKNQWRVDDKRRALRAQRRQQLKRLRELALPDPIGLLDARGMLTHEDIQLLQGLLLGSARERSARRRSSEGTEIPGNIDGHAV